MRSLRARIAVSYALLLVLAVVAVGLVIGARFTAILRGQAQARVVQTLGAIAAAAVPPPGSFYLEQPFADPLLALESPDALERWESPSTYIEVDNVFGDPLAKSFNLGTMRFPPVPHTAATHPTVRDRTIGGRDFLIASEVLTNGAHTVVVQVGEPLDEVARTIAQAREALVFVMLCAIAAVALLSYLLARRATGPIDELAAEMREIGSEHLDRRLGRRGSYAEIARLAQNFDDLLGRLAQAFARERQFISDASHELRTPLTSINANAQMLLRWGDRDETVRRESLETIVSESAALSAMVAGMLMLAKADSGESIPKEPLSLNAVASEAAATTAARAAERGLDLRVEPAPRDPIVLGDATLLRQAIANLIDNAIKFTSAGSVAVRIAHHGSLATVEVRDTGPGIDSTEIEHIFERFYRTDKSRSRSVPGTGLGLAIVRSIARAHDGTVSAHAPSEGGACFRLELPQIQSNSHGDDGALG